MTASAPFTRHNSPAFLTIEEAALTLNCSVSAIEEQVKRGELAKASGLGPRTVRIPREALWSDEPVPALDFTDRRIAALIRDGLAASAAAHGFAAQAAALAETARQRLDEAAALLDSKANRSITRKAAA